MDDSLQIPVADARKLVGAASGNAALLYLYLKTGAPMEEAAQRLRMDAVALDCARALLQQLGLLERPARFLQPGERPTYNEQDVLRQLNQSGEFSMLVGEAQRALGRVLSTEDLKILLSMLDYLGLSVDVVAILIHYCIERNRVRGVTRLPSLRFIEKEAYYWADNGIDTLEDAAGFVQAQMSTQNKITEVRALLQLADRRLTQAEEAYLHAWLDMGFDLPELQLAYERTCLNTGGLKWQYMNKILLNWHNQNLHTLASIQNADHPGKTAPSRTGSAGSVVGSAAVSPMGKAAIARLMQEEDHA